MSHRSSGALGIFLVLVVALAACIEDGEGPGVDIDGKADAWNDVNDPSQMSDLEYSWEALSDPALQKGASANTPWPDTYWPMQDDGYNHRWQSEDQLSPVELYDLTFNGWEMPEDFMELQPFSQPGFPWDPEYYEVIGRAAFYAHRLGGTWEAHNGRDDDDNGEVDDGWDGVEGWKGHCHAWSAASFYYQEPRRPVTILGSTFEVADIKALAESTFEQGQAVSFGDACRASRRGTEDDSLNPLARDEHGRLIADECRDANPGAFHIVLLNQVGLKRSSFVMDIVAGFEIWNHPIRDYEILQQDEVSLDQALQLLGRSDAEEYPYNEDAEAFVHVKTRVRYVVEGSASHEPYLPRIEDYTRTVVYEYLLELDGAGDNLDGAGDIIGGEWIDDEHHPDFFWLQMVPASPKLRVLELPAVDSEIVQYLVDLSSSEEPIAEGEEHTYTSSPRQEIYEPIEDLYDPPEDIYTWGVEDTITIPDSLVISELLVTLNVRHEYAGNLYVQLEREGREPLLLSDDLGVETGLRRTYLLAGLQDPAEGEETFRGEDAAGDWTLRILDKYHDYAIGRLDSWSVTVITRPTVPTD